MISKNKVIVSVAVVLAMSGVANAACTDELSFNLGGEVSVLNKPTYDKYVLLKAKKKPGLNLFVGSRFNKYFGAEVGYGMIVKAKTVDSDGDVFVNKVRNMYFDLLGYVPVSNQVDLIGALGIGKLKSKVAINGVNAIHPDLKSKAGIRVGAGAQYNIDNNWAARAMVRYQKGNKAFLKSNTSLSLGVVYSFR